MLSVLVNAINLFAVYASVQAGKSCPSDYVNRTLTVEYCPNGNAFCIVNAKCNVPVGSKEIGYTDSNGIYLTNGTNEAEKFDYLAEIPNMPRM